MTDQDLEQRLRAWYRADVDDYERAPQRLRSDLATLTQTAARARRPLAAGWRPPAMNRFAPFALAATALVVAILIGIGILVRSPNVGPSPVPGPTHSATLEPNRTPVPAAHVPAFWTTTGSMADGRFDFTATLLVDGRVLVAGGDMGHDKGHDVNPRALASAELYDPSTGTWTPTESMLTGRYRHTATLLPNGKVLVAGGNVNNSNVIGIDCCLATAELYDPGTGTWSATGSMNAARVDHSATLLLDGTVLVVGGASYPNTGLERFPVERYDPSTGTWSATEVAADGAGGIGYGLADTLLPDGRVLFDGNMLYDPRTGSWSSTLNCCFGGPLDTYYGEGTWTLLSDGEVLRAGGLSLVRDSDYKSTYSPLSTAALYDPVGGGWRATGTMHVGRVDAAAALLPDGRVLVIGGNAGLTRSATASAELYDPATGTWAATASMAEARFGEIAILLLDGRVLIVGGAGSEVLLDAVTQVSINPTLASAELYDPGDGS